MSESIITQPYVEKSKTPEAWRIVKLEKIKGERNGGRHNAFIFLRDRNGNRIDASQRPRIDWTWVGRSNEQIPQEPQPKNPPDEYDYDIPLERGVYASIWVRGAASDKVHAVTAMLPDEDEWNAWGHHSWEIWFEQGVLQQPQPQPQETEAQQLMREIEEDTVKLIGINEEYRQVVKGLNDKVQRLRQLVTS